MEDDIRDIRNDIERIKSDTHNINRIMTISNIGTIINDLKTIVGRSEIRAAILHLTKEKISAQELADKLNLDRRNLPSYMTPFTDKKSYITELKSGRSVYYQRAEIIDLINFEKQEAFEPLIESWKTKQSQSPKESEVKKTSVQDATGPSMTEESS